MGGPPIRYAVMAQAKLEEQAQRDREKPPKALNRRFIVIEGIYQNYGDIAPLRKLVELRDKVFALPGSVLDSCFAPHASSAC
eukprot:SAG31_NODE_918_length_11020_cov_14.801392_9_plen_82_part_00